MPIKYTKKGVLCRGMYFLYILKCKDNSFYTGITTNVERRFKEHKNGVGGHYTSSKKAVKIVYTERHPDRSSASKREAEIKSWRREKKLELLKSARHV
jgi:putative endonuclease